MAPKTIIGLGLAAILPAVVLLYPSGLDPQARLAIALSAFTVVMWTFEPAPIEYTSLILLLLLPLLGVLDFETTFAAFSGKAVWLIFAGMALSLTITETPLGSRIASLVLTRMGSYGKLLASIHIFGVVSALLIPSGVVRILLFTPMLVSLLETLGEKPGSRLSAAVILSYACSTYYGGTGVLTAGVPNLVILGVLESRGGTVFWGEWAAYLMPVIGLVRVALIYLIIRIALPMPSFRLDPSLRPVSPDTPRPISHAEKKVLGLLLLGVLLWASDAIHGIHPAYVGLVLVLGCYLPGWGPLSPSLLRKVNFPILIYIAAAFAIGAALQRTGLSGLAADWLADAVDLGGLGPLAGLAGITCTVLPFNFLGDTAAIAAILTPVILDIAEGIGLAALPAVFSVAIAASMVCVPYQAAPFVLAYSFRYVRMGQFIWLMTLISLITLVLLLPLNLLYWRLVGLV